MSDISDKIIFVKQLDLFGRNTSYSQFFCEIMNAIIRNYNVEYFSRINIDDIPTYMDADAFERLKSCSIHINDKEITWFEPNQELSPIFLPNPDSSSSKEVLTNFLTEVEKSKLNDGNLIFCINNNVDTALKTIEIFSDIEDTWIFYRQLFYNYITPNKIDMMDPVFFSNRIYYFLLYVEDTFGFLKRHNITNKEQFKSLNLEKLFIQDMLSFQKVLSTFSSTDLEIFKAYNFSQNDDDFFRKKSAELINIKNFWDFDTFLNEVFKTVDKFNLKVDKTKSKEYIQQRFNLFAKMNMNDFQITRSDFNVKRMNTIERACKIVCKKQYVELDSKLNFDILAQENQQLFLESLMTKVFVKEVNGNPDKLQNGQLSISEILIKAKQLFDEIFNHSLNSKWDELFNSVQNFVPDQNNVVKVAYEESILLFI